MTPIVRFYANAKNAEKAVKELKADGFDAANIHHFQPSAEGESDPSKRVGEEIAAGHLPQSSQGPVERALAQGRHVVSVYATYGRARPAVRILDACDPVEDEILPESYSGLEETRLTSEAFGIPMLTKRRFFTISSETGLASFRHLFGGGLLTNKPAPFSGAFGLKTLSERKTNWESSMGLPLRIDNPAWLSSKLGMKTLLSRKSEWTSSFGLPLLSKSPAPLSAVLGLPVLTQKKRDAA
ncbi:hypothetical protein [Rhodovibrio salinarum]|uniref:Uncharacterized protein n=1 Tax=Rhodovibrio salinarum TaxID=1087 RepID=A0A934QKQ3_9PROT|nr:hypothetical protein [Rhodovibrio salinarum]MBK1698656.1 hypothetical protein [Rhodovibrio salinarum]